MLFATALLYLASKLLFGRSKNAMMTKAGIAVDRKTVHMGATRIR